MSAELENTNYESNKREFKYTETFKFKTVTLAHECKKMLVEAIQKKAMPKEAINCFLFMKRKQLLPLWIS